MTPPVRKRARHTAAMRMRTPLLLACLALALPTAAREDAADPVARLRIEPSAAGYEAWADNLLAGPIEVRLDMASGPAPASQPTLPARASVPAGGSTLVALLQAPAGREGWLRLRLRGIPGSANARPQDVAYRLPVAAAEACIDQGFEGGFSHSDTANRYAIDFAVPEGTPVLAARAGVVMQVRDGFEHGGLDRNRDIDRANLVRILHDDGSTALYAHLAKDGARVRAGQRAAAGQVIGLSGNTGYSSGPHLHFAVQVNRDQQLEAIPFRMPGAVPAPDQAAWSSSSEGSTSSRHCGSLSSMPTARR